MRLRSVGLSASFAFACLATVVSAFAGCSDGEDGGSASPSGGGSGSDAGGAAGTGGQAGADSGPVLSPVCVKSVPMPSWAGSESCPAPAPASADALDAALGKAGIDRCSYGFSDDTMSIWKSIFADDKYQLPMFRPLHRGLLRLPGYAKHTESELSAALDGEHAVSSSILVAGVRLGASIDACADLSPFEPATNAESPLAAALAILISAHGGAPDESALRAATEDVPATLQKSLVPVLGTLSWAASERVAALGTSDFDDLDWLGRVHGFVIAPTQAFGVNATSVARLDKVDFPRMAAAAAIVARAVEEAHLEAFAGTTVPAVAVDTPIGAVVLGGSSDDSYPSEHLAGRSALLLDTGGDDDYRVPVGAGRDGVPVSLAIDLGGKDRYGYDEVPNPQDEPTRPPSDAAGRLAKFGAVGQTASRIGRQGSGVLGIGLLWDLGAEDDEYHSLALSQGSGSMGIGVLYDAGGSDRYVAESTSQGAGVFGVGVLLDVGGKDSYSAFFGSQGFGYVRSVGVLADGGGDDVYFADPGDPNVGGDPLYPSAQLPTDGNNSMCQGAGFGRRDDAGKLYMGGGHGVLYDRAGDDQYTASVFAQGAGYWLGFGMLSDAAGNDAYRGLWYVQGASAHFALALHADYAGNDQYNQGFPIRATSIGVGHDFSGALHLDLAGDDDYTAPGLSLGCGNAQGAGGFVDVSGTDSYAPAGGNTYGCAAIGHGEPFDTVRDVRPTIGVFVDASGIDTYSVPSGGPAAGNGASWSYPVSASVTGAPKSELSGAVDDDAGQVVLP